MRYRAMTLLIRSPAGVEVEAPYRPFVLHDVGWDFYEQVLRATGESSQVRIAFDQGSLEFTSPPNEHEQYGRLIGRLIEIIGFVRDIQVAALGSTMLNA
jgi:hypothetical protein